MIILKQDTEITGAETQYGHPINVYDDYMGPLWVCGHEFGPAWIIRAQSFDTAYEIWLDEQPTIDKAELWEAYGFETPEEYNRCVEECMQGAREYPDLAEGYQYQPNGRGTGIVCVGHYEWIQELTAEYIKRSGIRIIVERME